MTGPPNACEDLPVGECSATPPRDQSPRRQQRSADTRAALVAAARLLFGQQGYHGANTHDIVAATAVGRGALYHNFGSKHGLFEAVFREVAAEVTTSASASVAPMSGDTWKQLTHAVPAYLDIVASSEAVQRILLIDGPAVLGWQSWKDIQSAHLYQGFVTTLDMLVAQEVIEPQPTAALAHLIFAALADAALEIAHAQNPQLAQRDMTSALMRLIGGLRRQP